MTHTYISETKLNSLEEDFREYKKIPSIIATIVLTEQFSEPDINDWIRGSREHTQKALTDMIKLEANPKCYLWAMKQKAIKETYDALSDELKHICDVYLWGEYSYLKWREIGDRENISKSGIYTWRRKILETYAKKIGEIY